MDQIINSSITITTPMLECSLYLLHIGLFQVLVVQWRYPFYYTVCIDFDFKRLENNIPCLFCSWWLVCTQSNRIIDSLINTNTVGNNLALQSFVACHHWKMKKQYRTIQVLFVILVFSNIVIFIIMNIYHSLIHQQFGMSE